MKPLKNLQDYINFCKNIQLPVGHSPPPCLICSLWSAALSDSFGRLAIRRRMGVPRTPSWVHWAPVGSLGPSVQIGHALWWDPFALSCPPPLPFSFTNIHRISITSCRSQLRDAQGATPNKSWQWRWYARCQGRLRSQGGNAIKDDRNYLISPGSALAFKQMLA